MRLNPIADTQNPGKMLHEGILLFFFFFEQIISFKTGWGGQKQSIMEKRDLCLRHSSGDTHAAHTPSQLQHLCSSPADALYYVSLPSTGSMPPMQSWMDGGIVSPHTRLTSPGIQIHHQQTHATRSHTHTHPSSARIQANRLGDSVYFPLRPSRLASVASPFIHRWIHK